MPASPRIVRLLRVVADGHAPAVVGAADAAAAARALHEDVSAGDAARAELAAEAGTPVACAVGCNTCCANLIIVHEPEAIAIAEWLDRPDNRAVRDAFTAAYPTWRTAVGDVPERVRHLHRTGQVAAAERAYREVQRARVLCAFNRAGACSIYPVRPMVCRNGHALVTSANCGADRTAPPQLMAFEPLDQLMAQGRDVLRALQRAVRGDDGAPDALCVSVHRLIEQPIAPPAPAPGRNDPCPCGSGKKHKRCCGA